MDTRRIFSKKELRKLERDKESSKLIPINEVKDGIAEMFQKPKTGWPDYVWLKGTSYDSTRKHNRKNMNLNIQVANFDLHIGKGQALLENAEINIQYGKKYGIIGRNGIGKSVLLRAISNKEDPFTFIPSWFSILHVEQEITGDERPALELLLSSDKERLWLLSEAKRLEDLEKDEDETGNDNELDYDISDIYERLREIEAHKSESKAASILAGLQFNEKEMRSKPSKDYSGGWRMRISLARALFLTPELLILDEPTNHLDLHASIWLENYLKNYEKTLLLVSHDESILDECIDNIIYFSNKKLQKYKGNYSMFLKTKEQNDSQISKKKNVDNVKIQKIKESAQKNRGSKLGAKKKEEMDNIKKDRDIVIFEKDPKFKFPEVVDKQETAVLKFDDVIYSYNGGKNVVKDLSFGVYMDSRIALVGANGCGKSTIMKLMSGELIPTSGTLNRSSQLRIVKYDQHAEEKLDLEATCIEWVQRNSKETGDEKECRKILGRFGIQGNIVTQKIKTLSGGQKSRLVFAVLTLQKPHLMLLDEPTNHLDLFSIKALTEGLKEYGGGLVIISHNQKILSQCCNQTWVVHNNKVTKYEGTFDEYKNSIIKHFEEF